MKYLLGFALLFLFACEPTTTQQESELRYFPSNYSFIIKAPGDRIYDWITSDALAAYKEFKLAPIKELLNQSIKPLGLNGLIHFGVYEEGKGNLTYLALAEQAVSWPVQEEFTYEGQKIYKGNLSENNSLYWSNQTKGTLYSNSQLLLEETIRGKGQFETHPTIDKLFTKSLNEGQLTLVAQPKHLSLFVPSVNPKSPFSEQIIWEITFSNDELVASGISLVDPSSTGMLAQLSESSLISSEVQQYAPRSTQSLLTLSKPGDTKHPYLEGVQELAKIQLETNELLYLRSIASETLMQRLVANKKDEKEYLGNRIIEIEPFTIADDLPQITQTYSHVAVFENAFIFGQTEGDLRELLKFVSANDVLSEAALFQSVTPYLSSEISHRYLSESGGYAQVFQSIKEGDYFFTSASSIKKVALKKSSSITPILNLSLDAEAITRPQFVKNHYTGAQEIVVQDVRNVLYRFASDGKLLWKKQLEAKIKGAIHEVDLYRNRKLQLAFTTETAFHVLDRNGDFVEGYPKRFNDGNISELAVFDYDNSRNYRFVFSQGRDIYMYNNRGEKVNGFTYQRAEAPLAHTPKHFRIDSKDYIVFGLQNGQLKILQRDGKDRLSVSKRFEFSANELFLYRGSFAFTDKQGVLHQVSTSGALSSASLSVGAEHKLSSSPKTLVVIDGQKLQIKEKRMSLDYGIYTDPQLFVENDKIYISLLDAAAKKLYLYDSNGKLLPGFPVVAASAIDLKDIDSDKKVEFITKDEGTFLTLYRVE